MGSKAAKSKAVVNFVNYKFAEDCRAELTGRRVPYLNLQKSVHWSGI
jgi:hypothetical protein